MGEDALERVWVGLKLLRKAENHLNGPEKLCCLLHHKLIGKYPPCTQRLGLSEFKTQEEVHDMESSLGLWLEQGERAGSCFSIHFFACKGQFNLAISSWKRLQRLICSFKNFRLLTRLESFRCDLAVSMASTSVLTSLCQQCAFVRKCEEA